MNTILGLDIGGVISMVDHIEGARKLWESDRFLEMKPREDAVGSLFVLVNNGFKGNIHFVTKVREAHADRMHKWLDYIGIFDIPGINFNHLHICHENSEKATICQQFGITHFVDDKLKVLNYLKNLQQLFLFCPRPEEVAKASPPQVNFIEVADWLQLLKYLLTN